MRKAVLLAALLASSGASAAPEYSLYLQGGPAKYTQVLAGQTDLGVAYGLRLNIMPSFLGVEFAWLGTQHTLRETVQFAGDIRERLVTNGLSAHLRANVLPGSVVPYLFWGMGMTWLTLPNRSVESAFHKDNVGMMPFGGGVEAKVGPVKLGARFQYTWLMQNTYYVPFDRSAPRDSDFYSLSIDVGTRFF